MIVDIICGIIIAFGFYQGFSKGLIKTVFSVLSLVIAVVACLKLSPLLINFLQGSIDANPALLFVAGFILTFIIVLALIRFIGKKLDQASKKLHLSGINKLLGGAALGLFYAILLSIGLHFVNKIELLSPAQKESSFLLPVLEPLPRLTQSIGEDLKPVFSEFWDALLETVDKIKAKGEMISPKPSDG